MDPHDQLDAVYEGLVHWADVLLVSTPIRWGAASSLYFKMVERRRQEGVAAAHARVAGRGRRGRGGRLDAPPTGA